MVQQLLKKLGGVNLEDRGDKTAISEDHTLTWNTMLNSALGNAETVAKVLASSLSYENGNNTATDDFTSASGANGTFSSATMTFNVDKYELGVAASGNLVCGKNMVFVDSTTSAIALYVDTSKLISSNTGDGTEIPQDITTSSITNAATSTTAGCKFNITSENVLKKIKLPYYNASEVTSTIRIKDSNQEPLFESSVTTTVSTGTTDSVTDTASITGASTGTSTTTNLRGTPILIKNNCFLKTVTKHASNNATQCYLIRNSVIMAQVTFSGNVATFPSLDNTFMEENAFYHIVTGDDGASRTFVILNSFTTTNSDDVELNKGDTTCVFSSSTRVTSLVGTGTGSSMNNILEVTTETATTDNLRFAEGLDYVLSPDRYYIEEERDHSFYDNQNATFPQTKSDLIFKNGYIDGVENTRVGSCNGIILEALTGSSTILNNITVDLSDGTTTLTNKPINDIIPTGALSGELELTFNATSTDPDLETWIKKWGLNKL